MSTSVTLNAVLAMPPMAPSLSVNPVLFPSIGGSFCGVTVRLNTCPATLLPCPSSTVKVKLSDVVSLPLCTYTSRPASMSAWVNVVMAVPGPVVSSSCPLVSPAVTV